MTFNRKKISFISCLISTFIAHNFLLYNCFYINSMDASYVLRGSEIQIMSGRFIGRLIENFVTKLGFHTVIKPVNVLIALVFICLINMLVVEIIDIKQKNSVILFSMLFPLAPYIIQTLGFNFVCHFDFFAELLMVYAIYLVLLKKKYILATIFTIISIGIYQAYFSFGIGLLYLYIIRNVFENKKIKEILKNVIFVLIVLIIGFIIYFITNRIYMDSVQIGDRFSVLSKSGGSSDIINILNRISFSYIHFIDIFANEYGGLSIFKFVALVIAIFMVIVHIRLIVSYLYTNEKSTSKKLKGLIIYFILLILFPIVVDLNYILTGEVSYRTQTNIILILLLPIMINDIVNLNVESLPYNICTNNNYFNRVFVDIKNVLIFLRKEIVSCIMVFFICMFSFISIAEHYNLFIINKDYERQVMYMVSKIMNHPDYYDGITLIVSGYWNSTQNVSSASDQKYFHIHEKPEFSCLTVEYALEQHFKLYGSTKVTMMLDEESKNLVADMPSYPDNGCIKRVKGNGLLIKFSN